jgi:hypothetical protein
MGSSKPSENLWTGFEKGIILNNTLRYSRWEQVWNPDQFSYLFWYLPDTGICRLFKFPGISGAFQNLGLEKVGHSSGFVRDLCGALLQNYICGYVGIIEFEGLSHMCVFWSQKQGLW